MVHGSRIHQQAGQAEDIPGGIVHVDCHFDAGFLTGRHDTLQEILEVFPQLFLGDGRIVGKQLVQLRHALRLPAGEGHAVQVFQNILGHLLIIVLDTGLFIEQRGRAVPYGVEQVGACPVENGHEIVGDDLDACRGKVAQGDIIVFDILVAGGTADLDIVMDVDRLDNIDIEARGFDNSLFLCDFFGFPDFAGLLMVQRPDDAGHAGNLPDLVEGNRIVPFSVPAECHLHSNFLLLMRYPPPAAAVGVSCYF